MEFADKLNYLMRLTDATNKELAQAISVDRSLISLLRTGKRGMPRNQEHIQNMAHFFAKNVTADYQRRALAELMQQSSLQAELPVEILSDLLYKWMSRDNDMVLDIIDALENFPQHNIPKKQDSDVVLPPGETRFFYGNEGRRQAVRWAMDLVLAVDPASILIDSDDSLNWLMEDYELTLSLQKQLTDTISHGCSFCQILPSAQRLNSYVEALRYWFPIYISGNAQVYYYPRLKDDLYQASTVIVPGCFAQLSISIGSSDQNRITILTTEAELIQAITRQFQEHLALCRPALQAYHSPEQFGPRFQKLMQIRGATICKVSPLSITSIPADLLEECIEQTDSVLWKKTFQMYLAQNAQMEATLSDQIQVDLCTLADPEDIRAGNIPIGARFPTSDPHPYYTPETYIRHLKNILRLMDTYENYYFVPITDDPHADYNLVVNEGGMALLIRNGAPPLMLEIRRPEMVQSWREHLIQMAERAGFEGMGRIKIRTQIHALIRELQS